MSIMVIAEVVDVVLIPVDIKYEQGNLSLGII